MAADEMSEPEFIAFLKATLGNLATFSVDGSIHFVCMDWRHCFELTSAGRGVYSELKRVKWALGSHRCTASLGRAVPEIPRAVRRERKTCGPI
jgi:hypothetical protein